VLCSLTIMGARGISLWVGQVGLSIVVFEKGDHRDNMAFRRASGVDHVAGCFRRPWRRGIGRTWGRWVGFGNVVHKRRRVDVHVHGVVGGEPVAPIMEGRWRYGRRVDIIQSVHHARWNMFAQNSTRIANVRTDVRSKVNSS